MEKRGASCLTAGRGGSCGYRREAQPLTSLRHDDAYIVLSNSPAAWIIVHLGSTPRIHRGRRSAASCCLTNNILRPQSSITKLGTVMEGVTKKKWSEA